LVYRGYLAAVWNLKQKKYDKVAGFCTEEIEKADSPFLMDAHFLRGTMNLIWGNMVETELDLRKVAECKEVPSQVQYME